MSQPKATDKGAPARREKLRIRVEHLRQSRQRSPLGAAELIGLAASLLLLLIVIFAHLFFLRPAYSRLDTAQRKREESYKLLRTTEENLNLDTSKQVTIAEVTQSVEDFEANRLSLRGEGRIALLNTLNKLIRSNGLRNTAGPNYTALDPLAAAATPGAPTRTGNAKWQSIYPGLGVNVTVEGAYPNLRRFVREIETSNEFIVINSIELEKATDTSAATTAVAPTAEGEAKPVARGSLVSLRLDMAVYFRRETTDGTEVSPDAETR